MANSGPIMDDLVFFFIPFYTFQIPYTERVFYKQEKKYYFNFQFLAYTVNSFFLEEYFPNNTYQ